MKHKGVLVACFVGAFLVGLVVMLPASVLGKVLERQSNGRLSLEATTGTLWSGEADLTILVAPGAALDLGRVSWRLAPAKLLMGRLQMALRQQYGGHPGKALVVLRTGSAEVRDADFRLPAASLSPASPALSALGPAGDLRCRTSRFSWTRTDQGERFDGEASVDWDPAQVLTGGQVGAYRLNLRAAGSPMTGVVQTLRGPLHLDGEGSWSARQPLKMTARVRLGAESGSPASAQLFRLLCPRAGNECTISIG